MSEFLYDTLTDDSGDDGPRTYHRPSYRKLRDPEYRMHRGSATGWSGLVLVVLVGIVLGLLFWQAEYGTQRTVQFTVTSLDDQNSGSSHKYLVFGRTVAGQPVVFENTDAWFHGKTDSSDIQAALAQHVGQQVRCPAYGYRGHLFSSYPDLLDGCLVLIGTAHHTAWVKLVSSAGP